MNDKVVIGNFFLKCNEIKKFHGAFYEENDRKYRLRIDLENRDDFFLLENENFICCESKGKIYTLTDFWTSNNGYSVVGEVVTFMIDRVFYKIIENIAIDDQKQLVFDSVICEYNNFATWIKGTSQYAIDREKHLESIKSNYMGAHQRHSIKLNDGTSMNIIISGTNLRNFTEKFSVQIDATKKEFIYFHQIMYHFGKFLTILCNFPVEYKGDIVGIELNDDGDYKSSINMKSRDWVDEKDCYPHEILDYTYLKNDLNKILFSFFEKKEQFDLPISFLCASIYSTKAPGSSVQDFINITKAIESTYNILSDFSSEENDIKLEIERVLETIVVESDKNYLKEKLQHSHLQTFNKKMEKLLIDSQDLFALELKKCKKFSRAITNKEIIIHTCQSLKTIKLLGKLI